MNITTRLVTALAALALFAGAAMAQTCEVVGEAPMLAERVAAGDLPPAAERIPSNPMVLAVAEEIGTYGGEMLDLYDGSRLAEFRQFGYEGLVRWNTDGSEVIPNIAAGWEVSEDGSAYTFTLREGLRWSDGHPFTTADIQFYFDEVAFEPYNCCNDYMLVDGQKPVVEIIDDLTFSMSWDAPNSTLLQNLATSYGVQVTQFAAHYLEQFSMKKNPEAVEALMAEDGYDDYNEWWAANVGRYGQNSEYNNPDRPLMTAWIPTAPFIGQERFTFERNPYYFKVDEACNQLPYIDFRTWSLTPDEEVRVLRTMDGQDHFCRRDVCQPPNKAVLFDSQDQGDYRFVDLTNSDHNQMLLHIKYTHDLEERAALFQEKDFRVGLSLAMDRQNVIDTVYVGQGTPHQMAPRSGPFYNEQLATQFTEHDPELASEYLDRVLPERDANGMRMLNGEPFTFNVLVNAGFRADWADVMQLIERDWEAVGLDVNVIVGSDEFARSARQGNDVDAYVWAGENGTGQLPILAADEYVPEAAYGWYAWGAENYFGTEPANPVVTPPSDIQRMIELVSLIPTSASAEVQSDRMKELLQLHADGLWVIGLAMPEGDYRVVNSALRNVPNPLIGGWLYPGPGPLNFETFFYGN